VLLVQSEARRPQNATSTSTQRETSDHRWDSKIEYRAGTNANCLHEASDAASAIALLEGVEGSRQERTGARPGAIFFSEARPGQLPVEQLLKVRPEENLFLAEMTDVPVHLQRMDTKVGIPNREISHGKPNREPYPHLPVEEAREAFVEGRAYGLERTSAHEDGRSGNATAWREWAAARCEKKPDEAFRRMHALRQDGR
jgi:hypothetical protein